MDTDNREVRWWCESEDGEQSIGDSRPARTHRPANLSAAVWDPVRGWKKNPDESYVMGQRTAQLKTVVSVDYLWTAHDACRLGPAHLPGEPLEEPRVADLLAWMPMQNP
jgi:hypothetical protein